MFKDQEYMHCNVIDVAVPKEKEGKVNCSRHARHPLYTVPYINRGSIDACFYFTGNKPVLILRILLAPRGRARARAPPPSEADEGPVQPPRAAFAVVLGIDSMPQ